MNLALPLALVLALLGFLGRKIEGSWVAPAPLFAVLWCGIIGVAAVTFPELSSTATAGLYLVAASVAVLGGGLLARRREGGAGPERVVEVPLLRPLLLLSLLVGVGEIVVLFARRGFSLTTALAFSAIAQVTIANRSELYADILQQSFAEWLVYLVLYGSTLLGGVHFRLSRSWGDRLLGLSAPVMLSLVFGLYGSRFGALFGGAFWVSAYLAAAVLTAKEATIFTPRRVAGVVLAGTVLLLGFSILTQVVRYSSNMQAVGWRSVLADGFDYTAALGIWMDERGWVGTDLTAGARSFTRLVQLVGIRADPLPAIPVSFTSSNIYTVHRDLIEDFGTLGSLVVLAVLGYLAQVSYGRLRAGRVGALPLLAGLYAFFLTMPAVGFFFYTAPTLALVGFTLYLWGGQWLRRVHRARRLVLAEGQS